MDLIKFVLVLLHLSLMPLIVVSTQCDIKKKAKMEKLLKKHDDILEEIKRQHSIETQLRNEAKQKQTLDLTSNVMSLQRYAKSLCPISLLKKDVIKPKDECNDGKHFNRYREKRLTIISCYS